MFNAIAGLIEVSSLTGEPLGAAALALIVNTGKLFTTSLAIALRLGAGIRLVRLLPRDVVREGA